MITVETREGAKFMSLKDIVGGKRKIDIFAETVAYEERKKKRRLTEEEKRVLEVRFLKPDKLPRQEIKVEFTTPLKKQTVKLVFAKEEDYDLFCRHFKVLNYVETNVTDLTKLIAILKSIEDGTIIYENGTIKCHE